jgi:hypothetical protein
LGVGMNICYVTAALMSGLFATGLQMAPFTDRQRPGDNTLKQP